MYLFKHFLLKYSGLKTCKNRGGGYSKENGSGLLLWLVGWIRNAIQQLSVNKHGLVGWRCAYPSYQSTDLTHYKENSPLFQALSTSPLGVSQCTFFHIGWARKQPTPPLLHTFLTLTYSLSQTCELACYPV